MTRTWLARASCCAWAWAWTWTCSLALAQRVSSTQVLGAWVGALAQSAPEQQALGVYGADLGVTVQQAGSLRILFGDSWANEMSVPIGAPNDDAQASLSLAAFPDGDAVDAWVARHPAGAGHLSWQAGAPPLDFRATASRQVLPIALFRGGASGALLATGLYRAPITAFSNARSGAKAGAFVIYWRGGATECSGGIRPSCSVGTCDTGMGSCWGFGGENTLPCVLGTTRCVCLPVWGGGICQDRTSSVYDMSEDGRILASVMQLEIGNADLSQPERYYTRTWLTNKFLNPSAVTVNDFDPARVNGAGNDYRPADGKGIVSHEKVFVWGRPGYAGIGARGRDAELYFAYVDMPSYSATGAFAWRPKYFAGLVNGVAKFSLSPANAMPLDLSATTRNPLRSKAYERFDIVGMSSIRYVAALQKWVMFYGGDFASSTLEYLLGKSSKQAVRDPQGAIHARFASQPWGPWSAPVQVFEAGDPAVAPPIEGSQYAPGGVLHHPACAPESECVPGELAQAASECGRLYFPNIIEPWTMARERGAVDVYWNVSTWNPYGVVLMKTRIEP